MTTPQYNNVHYEYRSYIYEVYQPKKNQVTFSAMRYLKEFITGKLKDYGKMDDWKLTKRQNQIMMLLADGKDKDEIAEAMNLEDATITSQLTDIYNRYELTGKYKNSKAVVVWLKNTGRLNNDK